MRLKEFTFITALLVFGCREYKSNDDRNLAGSDTLQDIQFPILIEGGKKVVYQFSKMTPRGPRYYLDTVEYNSHLELRSLVSNALFPLQLSEDERNEAPGIIAISLPGYFEETIFGLIDKQDKLRINYKGNEIVLPASGRINFQETTFDATFANDSLNVGLAVLLAQTSTGTHRAGKGTLTIGENSKIVQESEIFLVCN